MIRDVIFKWTQDALRNRAPISRGEHVFKKLPRTPLYSPPGGWKPEISNISYPLLVVGNYRVHCKRWKLQYTVQYCIEYSTAVHSKP